MSAIKESLLENSKSAIISAIEIHNKPVFSYRYEVSTILLINAWELLLKAMIAENFPDVKLINKDGISKPFDECVSFISSQLGKDFRSIEENLKKIYEFRCHIIHFYKDPIDSILYSLMHKSVQFYNEFSKTHFNIDLAEATNLVLLPIGFKPFVSPVDFLSSESDLAKSSNSVQAFIKSIVTSTETLESEGIEESILTGFKMAVINENRITNADIIAGITKNPTEAKLKISNVIRGVEVTNDDDVKKVNIEEETLFRTMYVNKHQDVVNTSRIMFSDFKQGARFNRIMKEVKTKPELHRKRFLDVVNKTGLGQDFYTSGVFEELSKHYKPKN
jgi:hypothetical protein